MDTKDNKSASGSNELLKANTGLLVWLLFLGFGGGLMALYYAHIGYLPDIDWHSLLIYLAAASVIGASIGFLHFLSLLLPGFIWAEFLVCDSKLEGVLCYEDRNVREPSIFHIWKHIGILFSIVFAISHIFLPYGSITYLISVILLISISSVIFFSRFKTHVHVKDQQDQKDLHSRLFRYTFCFALSLALSQISVFLIYQLASRPKGSSYFVLASICTAVVIISNHAVAARYPRHQGQAILVSIVAAFLLLCTADRLASLPARMMTLYGFGGGQKVCIILTDDGVKTFESLGLPIQSGQQEARNRIREVEILSSVGLEYYLSLNGCKFTFPKSMIISWKKVE